MSKIKAKPVTSSYWILQKDNKKVGQVVQDHGGYSVKINGRIEGTFTTLTQLKAENNFEFTEIPKPKASETNDVHGYPTDGLAYNSVWNLQYKLPIFTPESTSKSWHCAGWYVVTINNKKFTEFCPKLITLQRNTYTGPFKTKPVPQFEKLFE